MTCSTCRKSRRGSSRCRSTITRSRMSYTTSSQSWSRWQRKRTWRSRSSCPTICRLPMATSGGSPRFFSISSDDIEKNLGEPPLVAMGSRQIVGQLDLERQVLFRCQRLHDCEDVVYDILDRVIVERQRELPRLDFRQVEHVINQSQQVFAVALHAFEHL